MHELVCFVFQKSRLLFLQLVMSNCKKSGLKKECVTLQTTPHVWGRRIGQTNGAKEQKLNSENKISNEEIFVSMDELVSLTYTNGF